MKQKSDGDEREIAFLLPPREGEAPVKEGERRAAKEFNRGRAASRQDRFRIFSSVSSISEPREAREEEKMETI